MKNIGDVVCAIIESGDRFLIAQRASDHQLAGKWEFPGGKVGTDESYIEALRREILEELNIQVDIHSTLTPNNHSYPHLLLTLRPIYVQSFLAHHKPLSIRILPG